MDGIGLLGRQLSIRRPSNYTPTPGQETNKAWVIPGALSTQVPEGPHKVFLGSLPPTMSEEESQQLASAFGELQAFTLSKDMSTGLNKGYAFFCYKDVSLTQIACAGLDGQVIGGNRLVCRPANQKGPTSASMIPGAPGGMGLFGGAAIGGFGGELPGGPMTLNGLTASVPMLNQLNNMGNMGNPLGAALGGLAQNLVEQPSRFLKMENMVTQAELGVVEEYEDILLDVTDECNNHGKVNRVEIPKPGSPDCGKIFVVYDQIEGALAAKHKLNGRKFNERTIVITFLREDEFAAKGF